MLRFSRAHGLTRHVANPFNEKVEAPGIADSDVPSPSRPRDLVVGHDNVLHRDCEEFSVAGLTIRGHIRTWGRQAIAPPPRI